MKEEETSVLHNGPVRKKLGPGLITGAADDDPSGIATYSQVGAGFGYSMLWTTFLTFPLMVGIQIVGARIGRVTGNCGDLQSKRPDQHSATFSTGINCD